MRKFMNISALVMWLLATAVKAQTDNPSTGQDIPSAQDTTESTSTTTTTSQAPTITESADVPQTGCNFPEGMEGDWLSTLWDDVTFTGSSKLKLGFDIGGHEGLDTFECFAASDNGEYVLKSENPFTYHRINFYLYTCIKFEKRNEDNYHLIVKTARNQDSEYEPVRGQTESETLGDNVFNEICNATFADWIKGDLLRKDREIEGALGCPDKLKGSFNVTFQDALTKGRCENGATVTSCDDPKTFVFDYSSCNENSTGQFTDEDKYTCVSGSSNKVLLYHQSDEPNSFTPFSCLVVTPVSNIAEGDENLVQVEATHVGKGCDPGWRRPPSDVQQSETFILTQIDDCEEDVVTTTPVPAETTTMSNDENTTISAGDNQTVTGNGSSSTNNTGNAEDAALSLSSNGFLVTFIVAVMAILLNDYAGLNL